MFYVHFRRLHFFLLLDRMFCVFLLGPLGLKYSSNQCFLICFLYGWYKWGIEVFNSQWVLSYTPFRNVSMCLQYLDIPMCVQCSSATHSCQTLCNPMDCSMPGLPVIHQLPEFTQTHAHWVSDTIQPFHPLLSPSPPAFKLSQHQGLFQWVISLHQVTKVL